MEEWQQVTLCWDVVCGFMTLKSPLLLGIVQPSQIVGAGVPGNGHARRHKIWNGHRQKEKDNGDADQKAFRGLRHNAQLSGSHQGPSTDEAQQRQSPQPDRKQKRQRLRAQVKC